MPPGHNRREGCLLASQRSALKLSYRFLVRWRVVFFSQADREALSEEADQNGVFFEGTKAFA
jgi:hypothetical protein